MALTLTCLCGAEVTLPTAHRASTGREMIDATVVVDLVGPFLDKHKRCVGGRPVILYREGLGWELRPAAVMDEDL